ncbi:MAG TPA: trypsin-like peptidase domain-containing protein, partial [Albitalea sp.]|nr:trypsin-like peptidase domain-containing protein [Albitalea sp.]
MLACSVLAFALPAHARSPAPPRSAAVRGPLSGEELNNISVFKSASPSVVNITALGLERELFSMNVQQVPRGTGTGFVWDDRGHIVTNFHVIQEASAARVTLSDQSSYKAQLVGVFPDRDIAVLKIDAPRDKLPPIAIGTSRDLQVGQRVYAIGNPFGLDQTLTTGIVSALNREIESVTRRTIRGAIQTDAAINPGNSGGPLLDSAGRLIGVNTAIFSPSGASAGIGFAIPVDEVNRIVPRIIRDGRMVRPAIGITAGPDAMRQALKL